MIYIHTTIFDFYLFAFYFYCNNRVFRKSDYYRFPITRTTVLVLVIIHLNNFFLSFFEGTWLCNNLSVIQFPCEFIVNISLTFAWHYHKIICLCSVLSFSNSYDHLVLMNLSACKSIKVYGVQNLQAAWSTTQIYS